MDRRKFLQLGAGALGAGLVPFASSAWGARVAGQGKRLVVVFLRGAVDGLNVVIPYGDSHYYEYRPTIAVAPPGKSGGALRLDARFALHPALAALMPLWQRRQLAFIHACGSPDPDRSHFESQAYMETATPGRSYPSGWMNRLAMQMHLQRAADTVSFSANTPMIVRGPAPVATFPTGNAADRKQAIDRDPVRQAFDRIYRGDARLGQVYADAIQTRETLMQALDKDMREASQGAPEPEGFARDTQRAARMMRNDDNLRLVFFQLGGWDTHVNQGDGEGQLANHLKPLGEGLATLADALGPLWSDTVVLVVSEFGRTVRENGDNGTDHGHGNAHWLLGGGINGGQVAAQWPGLSPAALHQDRDLPVTTDFRSVIALICSRHLGLSSTAMTSILPDFKPDTRNIHALLA